MILWLQSHSQSKVKHNPLMRDLLDWKASCYCCYISHIYREANQAADYLAKQALTREVVWSQDDIIDPIFAAILQANACNVHYIRKG